MSGKNNQINIIPASKGFSFKNAEKSDLDFIFNLILEGAENRHFSESFLTPEGAKGLKLNLFSILTNKQRLDSDKPAYAVIYHNNGEPVGFFINSSVYERKGTEIWMLAISKKYQNNGHGSAVLDEIMKHMKGYNGVVMARCHPSSEVMFKMLVKRGFEHKDTGEQGTRILVK